MNILSFPDHIPVILDDGFFPLLSVAWLGKSFRSPLVPLCVDEGTVLVLGLDVAVDVLDQKQLLKGDPVLELPLRSAY